jgi:glycosidase
MVFAFPPRGAIVSLKRPRPCDHINGAEDTSGKGQLVFIENHDVNRYASEVGGDLRKQKAGAALWYKDSGPWWTERYAQDDDGVSIEEQQQDKNLLLSFYRRLLQLRRTRPELRTGDMQIIATDAPELLAVVRRDSQSSSLLLVNLADYPVKVALPLPDAFKGQKLRDLITGKPIASSAVAELEAYAVMLLARPVR